jgi:hypothetical protein
MTTVQWLSGREWLYNHSASEWLSGGWLYSQPLTPPLARRSARCSGFSAGRSVVAGSVATSISNGCIDDVKERRALMRLRRCSPIRASSPEAWSVNVRTFACAEPQRDGLLRAPTAALRTSLLGLQS